MNHQGDGQWIKPVQNIVLNFAKLQKLMKLSHIIWSVSVFIVCDASFILTTICDTVYM